jgi:hypothetical protein
MSAVSPVREGLREPVPSLLARRLRRLVYDHAVSERRHRYRPQLHVGHPGGVEEVFAVRPDEPLDHALRADVVAAMVRRWRLRTGTVEAPLVWLLRPGELELQDVDACWLAASRQAFAEAGLPLTYVVANRHGWLDPRSGLARTWVRMRRRSPGH